MGINYTEYPLRTPALKKKAQWLWEQTVLIHSRAPETRLASSLSLVEIFTVLYYGGFIAIHPDDLRWEHRDRLIVSKGHGGISLYALFADLGCYPASEIERVGQAGSFLGSIPDPIIPGFETVNGSLGHGLGVGCGIAYALTAKGCSKANVIVIAGDGELQEGAMWEAAMFAGQHRLSKLICIVDANKKAMLDHTDQIITVEPLASKFESFGWQTVRTNGHDIPALLSAFKLVFHASRTRPMAIIADTIKGRGIPVMEQDPLCHVRTLSKTEIRDLLEGQRD